MTAVRGRDFRLLWGSDAASHFGSAVSGTALALVGVVVVGLSPFEQGVVQASGSLAFLLIGLPAGVWVDRLRRRPVMFGADFARAALCASVPVAAWAGWLSFGQLVGVALLTGAMTVMFDVASTSVTPAVVGREHLYAANSRLQTTGAAARLSGPGLAGLLAQLLGAANALGMAAASYLGSALLLRILRVSEPEPEQSARRRLVPEVVEGLRFTFGHPVPRALAGFGVTMSFFATVGQAMYVLFLARTLGLPATAVGLVVVGGGVGAVLGAATATRWITRFGDVRALLVVWLTFLPPSALLLPLAGPGWQVTLFVVGLFGIGYGGGVYNVAQVSLRQAVCRDELLGRMNASLRFITWGVMPIGALAGGAIGELVSVRAALWVLRSA